MPNSKLSVTHIALVGGGYLCKELFEKTTFDYTQEEVFAPIIAVADPDPQSPGMQLAEELGLLTFTDHRQLYDPRYSIHLIILLTPDEEITIKSCHDFICATYPLLHFHSLLYYYL